MNYYYLPYVSRVSSGAIFKAVNKDSPQELLKLYTSSSKAEFVLCVNERNDRNETPIQVATRKGHFHVALCILKFLQEFHSDESYKLECLDVISFVLSTEIPFVKQLICLIDMYVIGLDSKFLKDASWLELVLLSIRTNSHISKHNKILSFELIGAAYISGRFAMIPTTYLYHGLQCWVAATTLRLSSAEGDPAIPKTPLIIPSDLMQNAFGEVVEFTTLEELEQLKHFELRQYFLRFKHLRIQALLIIQRIVSQILPKQAHPYYFHFNFLLDFGWDCLKNNQYSLAMSFSLLILEHFDFGSNSTSYFFKCMNKSDHRLFLLASCVKNIVLTPDHSPAEEELIRTYALAAVKYEVIMVRMMGPLPNVDREAIERVYDLLTQLFTLCPQLTQQEKQVLDEYIAQFILWRPFTCHDLLYVASKKLPLSTRHYEVIRFFIMAGVDPNCVDEKEETPLHLWAQFRKGMTYDSYFELSSKMCIKKYWTVFQAIVDGGGRLDKASPNGETPLSILKCFRVGKNPKSWYIPDPEALVDDVEFDLKIITDPYMESFFDTAHPLPLRELCAQVIRFREIPYQDYLPNESLKSLIHPQSLV